MEAQRGSDNLPKDLNYPAIWLRSASVTIILYFQDGTPHPEDRDRQSHSKLEL